VFQRVRHQRSGHVLEASLGYYLNPLVNVVLGVLFFSDRLSRTQKIAVGLAAAGLAVQAGRLPWIALVLALTFGFYGLLRKVAVLGALEGLTLETLMLAPVAAVVLAWWSWQGQGALVQGDASTVGWLLLAGPMTAVPLLLFAAGARRIPMSTLGILQYISPSLQFALGVWVYNEAFQPARLVGFVLIWAALVVYSVEGWWARQRAVLA